MSRNIDALRAYLHRAQQLGLKTMHVPTLDLVEVLAKLESLEARGVVQFGGQHIGWCKPESVRAIQSGEKFFAGIRRRKNEQFTMSVCVTPIDEPKGESPNNQEGNPQCATTNSAPASPNSKT